MKKNFKVGFILILLTAFVLTGVAIVVGGGKEGGAGADKPLEGVKLKAIAVSNPEMLAVRKYLPEFKEKTGIDVTMEAHPYPDARIKIIFDAKSGKAAYDVYWVDCIWVGEMSPYLTPMEDFVANDADEIKMDDFLPNVASELATWDNTLYAMPITPYFHALVYRKSLLKAAGIKVPTTFDELRDAAAKLNNPDDGVYGITFNLKRGDSIAQSYFEYIWNFGGSYLDANNRPLFDRPASIEFMEWLVSMLPYTPPDRFETDWFVRAEAFQQGRVAMVLCWNLFWPMYEDPEKSKVVGDVGWSLWPTKPGVKRVQPLGGWAVGINKATKKQEAAWEFVKWLTGPEFQKTFVGECGGMPARYSSIQDPSISSRPENAWFPFLEKSAPYILPNWRPKIPESADIHEILARYMSEITTGSMSPEEGMKAANKEIEQVLKDAGYF